MKSLLMERKGPRVTSAEVASFEKSVGYRLPDDYRDFLLSVNGGYLDSKNCEIPRPGETFGRVVHGLTSLNAVEEIDDLATHAERAWRRIPKELLKIGYDQGGGYFVLVLSKENHGQVWHHNYQLSDGARGSWRKRKDYNKVADSFTEFVDKLGPLTKV